MSSVGSSTLAKKRDKPPGGRPASGSPPEPREAVFHPEFREDLRSWIEDDRRIALRILELVEAVVRDRSPASASPSR